MKYLLTSLVFAFVFTSCSSKQYYNPKNTGSVKVNIIDSPAYIKSINSVGATLEDNRYLDSTGISRNKLKDGYFFINNSNSDIISANKNGELFINNTKHLKFKSNVIAATLSGDLLALIFSNNSVALYDIKNDLFKMKKYLQISHLNDTRIAMPLFLNTIVLFPTLDGKILLVSKKTYEVTKTINIDPNSEVNNIIFLKAVGDYLVAASPNVLLSLGKGKSHKKELFIQSYALNNEHIYIATLDGQILKLDTLLEIQAKIKFKFAKFQALSADKSIFAIESQGFVVASDLNLTKFTVDKISFENDEKVFVNKNKIYFEDKLLTY